MQQTNTDPIYEFYTNHPYPPPLDNLDRARDMWQDENIHRGEFHLLWPQKEYRGDLNVLVAGCGTWQGAKYAICHPAARVVAIDVSPTSLEHTNALKQKYDLANLEARQLSIEKAADLDQEFDLIICTGVLHHLVDPGAGLRALRAVLRSEGAMYLMVYAPYGRTGVYMMQDYCRRLGVDIAQQEIADLIAVLKALPQHHPLLATQGGSREFYSGALADALLNPRDRSYSVPELLEFLEQNDLRLGRWYWQAPYLPQCGAISTTPHAPRLAALPASEQFIAMELWRGLMTNHSVVVQRNDHSADESEISFDGDRYLSYVPIRLPWTMCVEERLPPGAAGVLVNQTHQFQDLFLIVNAQEKQLFEAIDGRRSIAEIAGGVEGADATAREFFQKLWWYDQVVFNTSTAR